MNKNSEKEWQKKKSLCHNFGRLVGKNKKGKKNPKTSRRPPSRACFWSDVHQDFQTLWSNHWLHESPKSIITLSRNENTNLSDFGSNEPYRFSSSLHPKHIILPFLRYDCAKCFVHKYKFHFFVLHSIYASSKTQLFVRFYLIYLLFTFREK